MPALLDTARIVLNLPGLDYMTVNARTSKIKGILGPTARYATVRVGERIEVSTGDRFNDPNGAWVYFDSPAEFADAFSDQSSTAFACDCAWLQHGAPPD